MSRRATPRRAFLLCLVSIASGLGCANLGPGISGTPCPVAWVPTDSIPAESATLRARMQLRIRDREVHLQLIAERRPGELVVVGLARFGVRLFAVRQRGLEVEIEGAASSELEQIAIWAMDALHRVYWITAPSDPAESAWTWAGEQVREDPNRGARRRVFSLPGDRGQVTIDYPRSSPDLDASEKAISIRNPWCGYEALIVPIRGRDPVQDRIQEPAT